MNNITDDVRGELLAVLADASDAVLRRHGQIVKDALRCPDWCARDHGGAEEVDSLTSHESEPRFLSCRGSVGRENVMVRTVLDAGDPGPFVALLDDRFTAEEARALAAALVEFADRVDAS